MNRRRQHPAAVSARRARIYRAARMEERMKGGDAREGRTSSRGADGADSASSHGAGLSGRGDVRGFPDVEEAA